MREITARAIWFWNFTSSASTSEQSSRFPFPLLLIHAAFVRGLVGLHRNLVWSLGFLFKYEIMGWLHLLLRWSSAHPTAAGRAVCTSVILGINQHLCTGKRSSGCTGNLEELSRDFPCPHLEFPSNICSTKWLLRVPLSCTLWCTQSITPIMLLIFRPEEGSQTTFYFFVAVCSFKCAPALAPVPGVLLLHQGKWNKSTPRWWSLGVKK